MPRRIINGQPELLPAMVVQEFLKQHIPYRLEMLRLAEENLPPPTTRESAFVEAAIVSGRILLDFLGVRSTRKGGLQLAPSLNYRDEGGFTDDVKVVDVGGRFVDLSRLDSHSAQVLANFYDGASKAAAHFTWDSGHGLDLDNLKEAIPIIRRLMASHLSPNASGASRFP